MNFDLKRLPNGIDRKGPVVVIIMDGVGIGKHEIKRAFEFLY